MNSAKKAKPDNNLNDDDEKDRKLAAALAYIRSFPTFTVIEHPGQASPQEPRVPEPTPLREPEGRSILQALRDPVYSRPDLHSELKFGEVCPECGMLLLDSDTPRNPKELNRLLRAKNVSVCVLRSASQYAQNMANQPEDDDNSVTSRMARMGDFERTVDTEWERKTEPPRGKVGFTWNHITRKMKEAKTSLLSLPGTSWLPTLYATTTGFKKFWEKTVDAVFTSTTWPLECEISCAGLYHPENERTAFFQWFYGKHPDRQTSTLDANIIDFSFAVVIGGEGSPPHIDTITDLLSADPTDGDDARFTLETSLAIGYIIQGIKYFWALPPRKGYSDRFIEFYRTRLPVDMTENQQTYREQIFDGDVPFPFQGRYSMGWPSEGDWDQMKIKGVNNHFHRVIAGDRYIIVDGAFHAVINHPWYQPAAAAYDDRWINSRSDLNRLRPTFAEKVPQ